MWFSNHLNQQQINAYLDRDLSSGARAQVDAHLSICDACYAALQTEQRLRSDWRQGFQIQQTQQRGRRDDPLAGLLPGIMAEVRQPVQQISKLALVLAGVLVIAILLPMFPNFEGTSRAADDGLFNVPVATHTPLIPQQDKKTPPPMGGNSEISSAETLHLAFDIEYASPAPLPQATADASLEPNNH